jgi:SAM-dependent methyltransferase
MPLDDYRRANRANWSERVAGHWDSEMYDVERFIAEPDRLASTVEFEIPYMGDVRDKRLVHLQCHFGKDTLSWARLGAEVTGVDFSEEAVAAARRLSEESKTPGRFVVSELYDAPETLDGERFDIVYTGVGAINWLPDIAEWGRVVSRLLVPGGTFFIREGHPVLWSLRFPEEDPHDETLVIEYPYFETEDPIIWDDEESYAGTAQITNTRTYEWNHGLGEVVMALLDAGLELELLEEHRFLEWPGQHHMAEDETGRWRLPEHQRDMVPLMYSLRARKPA